MGRLYDVPVPLQLGRAYWPDTDGFQIRQTMQIANGDLVNNTMIECVFHVGTHVYSPLHFVGRDRKIL